MIQTNQQSNEKREAIHTWFCAHSLKLQKSFFDKKFYYSLIHQAGQEIIFLLYLIKVIQLSELSR